MKWIGVKMKSVNIKNNMIYLAHQLKAKFDAGLMLAGQEEDGSLKFTGTTEEFAEAERLEEEHDKE